MKQHTLKKTYTFEGKGLHTGQYAHMTVRPGLPDSGIIFKRTDLSDDALIPAVATNVTDTSRSTTISCGEASVHTVEHIMSALFGLGVDNAVVEIDNVEVPILDGSARLYVEAIKADGTEEQDAERRYIEIAEEIVISDEKSGSYVKITPADEPKYEATVDFGSKVLGVQTASWDEQTDYAEQLGKCRTFVFFHEIEFLFKNGLVKGGDVDNAIVVVEHPVSDESLETICKLFNKEKMAITGAGYLNNLELRFPDECGRHKMLDLLGDLSLAGRLKAHITAYKPGHMINTNAAKAILASLNNR